MHNTQRKSRRRQLLAHLTAASLVGSLGVAHAQWEIDTPDEQANDTEGDAAGPAFPEPGQEELGVDPVEDDRDADPGDFDISVGTVDVNEIEPIYQRLADARDLAEGPDNRDPFAGLGGTMEAVDPELIDTVRDKAGDAAQDHEVDLITLELIDEQNTNVREVNLTAEVADAMQARTQEYEEEIGGADQQPGAGEQMMPPPQQDQQQQQPPQQEQQPQQQQQQDQPLLPPQQEEQQQEQQQQQQPPAW